MKIVIGNYPNPEDSRNLILNAEVSDFSTSRPGSILYAIVSKIEGIDTAPYRNGTGDWSGADGGYISSQLYSARTITISGTYIDRRAGCDYSDQNLSQFDHIARLYIRSRLPIRKKQYIRLFMDSGMTFYTEGYCVDVKMDYTFIGHGEYQIAMYCPDPALYRGEQNGTLGSEWNSATLHVANNVGFTSSKMIDPETDPVTWESAKMYLDPDMPDDNHGISWKTGGRSTPIEYAGDFPYYPQFVIEPDPGEQVINPKFSTFNEDKFFGLGYPESDIARFEVTDVGPDNEILSIEMVSTGAYDANYSGTTLFNVLESSDATGFGAKARITMSQNGDVWEISEFELVDPGVSYHIGDIITPAIQGAAILIINSGDRCVIDMAEHTATLNGESVSYYITPGSEWFQLDPLTTNNIAFSSAGVEKKATAQARWRNGYQGV